MKVVGLGGGSGAGKTTVCNILTSRYPDEFQVLHLDDYHMEPGPDLPYVDTMINWEHPGVVAWQALRYDLMRLRTMQSVERRTRSRNKHSSLAAQDRPTRMLEPRPTVIVEGHLALADSIIKTYDYTVYLDADTETRAQRRRDARGGRDTLSGDDRYVDMVLRPMHATYIEPTKNKADIVIDVRVNTAAQIAHLIRNKMLLLTGYSVVEGS